MIDQVDTSAVVAARAGDRATLEKLVVEYLPLVYSIARRALPVEADADDVVQETMVRLVKGIGGLREPERFRSWLVAITVNQIRDHRARSQAAPLRLAEHDEQPDRYAEFVDRALTRVTLNRQRRELEPATRWLDLADRELLSLWTLECGDHLTRAEIAHALGTSVHNATVKVGRLRTRLDTARLLTRALSATPRCPGLTEAAAQWSGEPNPLWRKRLLRHVDGCPTCREAGADLVPVQRLLMASALLLVPLGYADKMLPGVLNTAATRQVSRPKIDASGARTMPAARPPRIAGVAVTKPVLAAASVAMVAVCGIGVTAFATRGPDSQNTVELGTTRNAPPSSSAGATSSGPASSSITSTQAAPSSSTVPSATAPSPTRSPTSVRKPTPTSTVTPTSATPTKSSPDTSSFVLDPNSSRMLTRLNEKRRELGLAEVKESPDHVKEAYDCAAGNLRAGTFEHCGYEVLYGGGGHPKPEDLVDSWFWSPRHREALTQPGSRWAGAVIVNDPEDNRYIAAINLDY
ncbi:sigma-70 family RNA polymerase sigma factor [Solihabitans fulvus]|uniref:sigma-70 family RNA polymerase sigma factor n=1 Tax=Solihabitans fulvus TaxID=1892852 RepID=UPI00166191FD|nr:sigma-70 family RNA polymerase sigma factor [Solihabitans fulvus]